MAKRAHGNGYITYYKIGENAPRLEFLRGIPCVYRANTDKTIFYRSYEFINVCGYNRVRVELKTSPYKSHRAENETVIIFEK